MDANMRITSMLGTAVSSPASGSPQMGPAARGTVTPSVNAIATNGKLTTQSMSKLAETLQQVRDELSA